MNVKCKTWGFGFPCERIFVLFPVGFAQNVASYQFVFLCR